MESTFALTLRSLSMSMWNTPHTALLPAQGVAYNQCSITACGLAKWSPLSVNPTSGLPSVFTFQTYKKDSKALVNGLGHEMAAHPGDARRHISLWTSPSLPCYLILWPPRDSAVASHWVQTDPARLRHAVCPPPKISQIFLHRCQEASHLSPHTYDLSHFP